MHIYVFGSIVRGDIELGSDFDALAIIDAPNPKLDPQAFSIYTYERIKVLWKEGNPFAWHLATESRLVFTEDDSDYINDLGAPNPYIDVKKDCKKFYELYVNSAESVSVLPQLDVE